jgi:hypothetical protein
MLQQELLFSPEPEVVTARVVGLLMILVRLELAVRESSRHPSPAGFLT